MNNDQTDQTTNPAVDQNATCPKCGKNPCECSAQPVDQNTTTPVVDPNAPVVDPNATPVAPAEGTEEQSA